MRNDERVEQATSIGYRTERTLGLMLVVAGKRVLDKYIVEKFFDLLFLLKVEVAHIAKLHSRLINNDAKQGLPVYKIAAIGNTWAGRKKPHLVPIAEATRRFTATQSEVEKRKLMEIQPGLARLFTNLAPVEGMENREGAGQGNRGG
jgi:hypothetical protein